MNSAPAFCGVVVVVLLVAGFLALNWALIRTVPTDNEKKFSDWWPT